MKTYTIEFDVDWPIYFNPIDESIKERIMKKMKKILMFPTKRHLKKSQFFVDEVGQYRITYRVFENYKTVKFYFIGTHKEYEQWYKHEF